MEPIEIVRKLAAADPLGADGNDDAFCALCGAFEYGGGGHVDLGDPANHAADCPWRLARELVAVRGQG